MSSIKFFFFLLPSQTYNHTLIAFRCHASLVSFNLEQFLSQLVLFCFFFSFFSWLPYGTWSSWARDQINLWGNYSNAGSGSLTHCASWGMEPVTQCSRDATNPVVPQQEFLSPFSFFSFLFFFFFFHFPFSFFLPLLLLLLLLFFFLLFRAEPMAYGSSQGWGRIGAVAAGLHHSQGIRVTSTTYTTAHNNAGSLTHWARPGIVPTSSWILVRLLTSQPWWKLPGTPFLCFLILTFLKNIS